MLVDSPAGRIRGVEGGDGVVRFLGVPYAAAPVGDLRFAEPQPRGVFKDVFDAGSRGVQAPQRVVALPGFDASPVIGTGTPQGPDCLTVNIWRPSRLVQNAPVMVYIHGGFWAVGSHDIEACDGSAFARDGIVVVSMNYRLGMEGFLPLDGAPSNLGLRDQILALQWVRANIAAFGGDPYQVTAMGESAGGASIAMLMTSPRAEGLFHRAIVQSGHGSWLHESSVGRRVAKAVACELGVPASAAGLRSRSIEQGLDALSTVSAPTYPLDLRNETDGEDPLYGLARFTPVLGDDVVPTHPLRALEEGAGGGVPLLIGTCRDEANTFFRALEPIVGLDRRGAVDLLSRYVADAADVLSAHDPSGSEGGTALIRALTDLLVRGPVRRFADSHRGETHVFEFTWRSPALAGELGAGHGVDIPFVFDTLSATSSPDGLTPGAQPQDLADRVHGTWVRFIVDGRVPWPAYTPVLPQVHDLSTGRTALETTRPRTAGSTPPRS